MKKLLSIILISFLSLTIVSCGITSKVPEGMSQEMYDLGKKTSDITQKYVDGDITAGSAYQQIDQISEEAKKVVKKTNSDYQLDTYVYDDITTINNYVYQDDSVSVVDFLTNLNDILTPSESNDSDNQLVLSEVLDGTWDFEITEGELEGHITRITFDIGTFHIYDYAPNSNSPTGYNERDWGTQEYRTDDENMVIITQNGSKDHRYAIISNLTKNSFDFVVNPDEAPQKGSAHKKE